MAAHPLQAIRHAVGAAGGHPRPMQLSSLFQGANDGPANTAAKITGVQTLVNGQMMACILLDTLLASKA